MQALRWVLPFIFVFSVFSLEVYLIWPPDLAQTVNQTPEFRFKVVDNFSTTFSCTLYIDNSPFGTNESVLNDTEVSIIANSSLSLGDHNWYINCTDGTNYNVSETRTIGIGQNFSRCAVLIDSNVNYYLAGDIIDSNAEKCIEILNNNITLDCQNHIIDGLDVYNSKGVYIASNSTRIFNCIIKNWDIGIYFDSSLGGALLRNISLLSSGYDVYLNNSFENILEDITSKSARGITLYMSNNNTIRNSVFSNKYVSLYVSLSSNNTFKNLEISSGQDVGVTILNSNNNTFKNISFLYCGKGGINLYDSKYNIFEAIDIKNCPSSCFSLSASALSQTVGNIIRESIIENCSPGISISTASSNYIYNNLFNNTLDISFSGIAYQNYWNTTNQTGPNIVGGPYIGGNYWGSPDGSGFSDTCKDINEDGFCDKPYNITTNNVDYLPLAVWPPPPKIILLSSVPYIISSNFSLSIPYSIRFYFEKSGYFRFYFDYGNKNYSVSLVNGKIEIGKDIYLIYSKSVSLNSGIISVSCDQNVKISVGGYSFVINENCLGGKIRFECDSCKIGPLGIVGEIS